MLFESNTRTLAEKFPPDMAPKIPKVSAENSSGTELDVVTWQICIP